MGRKCLLLNLWWWSLLHSHLSSSSMSLSLYFAVFNLLLFILPLFLIPLTKTFFTFSFCLSPSHSLSLSFPFLIFCFFFFPFTFSSIICLSANLGCCFFLSFFFYQYPSSLKIIPFMFLYHLVYFRSIILETVWSSTFPILYAGTASSVLSIKSATFSSCSQSPSVSFSLGRAGDHLWDTQLSFLQPKLVVMLPGAIS